jgi:hypothetical protein
MRMPAANPEAIRNADPRSNPNRRPYTASIACDQAHPSMNRSTASLTSLMGKTPLQVQRSNPYTATHSSNPKPGIADDFEKPHPDIPLNPGGTHAASRAIEARNYRGLYPAPQPIFMQERRCRPAAAGDRRTDSVARQ